MRGAKEMQNKTEKIMWWGILLFFFIYFLQCLDIKFLDVHNYFTVIFGGLLCLALAVKQRKIRVDLETCLIAVTVFIYFGKKLGFSTAVRASYFYVAMVIYILAHYAVKELKRQEDREKKFLILLMVMVLGVTLHGIANSEMFFKGEFWGGTNRVWKDFWSKDIIYGTMQVAYFLPAFASVFFSLLNYKKNKLLSIILSAATLIFLTVALQSSTRTPVLILPVVFFVQCCLYFFLEKEKAAKFFTKKRLLILAGCLLAGAAVIVIALLTTSVGQTFLTAMSRDGGIFNNIRFKVQRRALEQLFVYPMGGNLMDHLEQAHTHNAWLDIADIGGLIPFFAFVLYTGLTIYELFKLLGKKGETTETKVLVTGLFVVYFVFFTIEPSLDWNVNFMTPWLFLHGMIHGYVKEEERGIRCYFP